MKFEYLEPESIADALAMLGRYKGKSKVIAGGTDLMVQMRTKAVRPEYVIDITRIPSLDHMTFDGDGGLQLGALTTIRTLETSGEIRERFPLMARAASQLASVPIRNVATVGGNVCNALPSAEMSQVLVALSAQAKIIGPGGARLVPVNEFFTGVGKTVLEPDEILQEILLPRPAPNSSGVYIKHSPRGPIDLAIVNVTVLMTIDPDRKICRDAKIVLGAVSSTPMRARSAENLLKGKAVVGSLIDQAAQAASDESNPRQGSIRGSFEYKKEMVKILTGRAIRDIIKGA